MLRKLLIALAVLTLGVYAYAATRPDTLHVERSKDVNASPMVIFTIINDITAFPTWSPWQKIDAAMTKTFSGPKSGVGATYEWVGNSDVGQGKMSTVKVEADRLVVQKLEFIEVWQSIADLTFKLEAKGASTKVTWGFDSQNDPMSKLMGVFRDTDAMLGRDFEEGLTNLSKVAESAAKKQAEEATDAAAAAAAALMPVPQSAPRAPPERPLSVP